MSDATKDVVKEMPRDAAKPERPNSVIVTLKAGGVFFAAANVICVAILVWAYLAVKLEPKTLSVTGSARKAITSDLVTWSGVLRVSNPDLIKAYDELKSETDKVKAYLVGHGIAEREIAFSAITTTRRYEQKFLVPPAGAGGAAAAPVLGGTGMGAGMGQPAGPQAVLITTDKVEMYTLTQAVSIESQDMVKVPEVARSVTELIKDGVEIDSGAPSYLYTKLSELKINMLADATKDATSRAEQIVNNAHGTLGKLVEARMGVMQINPKGVSATSAEGNNDTTSLEKEIMAIVSVKFEVR